MLGFSIFAAVVNLAAMLFSVLWGLANPGDRSMAFLIAIVGLNSTFAWLLVAGFHRSSDGARSWTGGPANVILGLTILVVGGTVALVMGRAGDPHNPQAQKSPACSLFVPVPGCNSQ